MCSTGSWLKDLVLKDCHDSPCARHPGVKKTLELVRRHYWWSRMDKDILEYVSRCIAWQTSKYERVCYPGFLKPLPTPDRKWQSISINFIVGLPRTER
jgi:hypothetical protein